MTPAPAMTAAGHGRTDIVDIVNEVKPFPPYPPQGMAAPDDLDGGRDGGAARATAH